MATKTTKTFKVGCIKCGAEDAVTVNLNDLDAFGCDSCSETWTTDDVRAFLSEWRRVLAWIDLAPTAD
jgi:hypothetical protein